MHIELDEQVKFFRKWMRAPVILINKFNVKPEEVDQFLKVGC
jgi:hypothetical protein